MAARAGKDPTQGACSRDGKVSLEVSVKSDRPPRWEWQVTSNGEMIANGFEDGRIEAKFEGYDAMFLLLAAGWAP
jgi:hypothetical protein